MKTSKMASTSSAKHNCDGQRTFMSTITTGVCARPFSTTIIFLMSTRLINAPIVVVAAYMLPYTTSWASHNFFAPWA
eukprot:scaffold3426_cov145-Amphora_coffeaeformis.AAC.5